MTKPRTCGLWPVTLLQPVRVDDTEVFGNVIGQSNLTGHKPQAPGFVKITVRISDEYIYIYIYRIAEMACRVLDSVRVITLSNPTLAVLHLLKCTRLTCWPSRGQDV